MATTDKAKAAAATRKGSRRGGEPPPRTDSEPQRASPSEADAERLRGRADQLGAILAKGLDLAEAGMSLGLTVIRRVGSAAQESVFDRFAAGGPQAQTGAPDAVPVAGSGHEQWTPQGHAAGPAGREPEVFSITNRLPIAPGGLVSVSFSINNDSVAAPKRVSLRVEGFTGEANGGRLSGDLFTVRPAQKTIAAMDFEKFVLKGEVPRDAPQDVYHGWIVVSSVDDFSIPVRLVVLST